MIHVRHYSSLSITGIVHPVPAVLRRGDCRRCARRWCLCCDWSHSGSTTTSARRAAPLLRPPAPLLCSATAGSASTRPDHRPPLLCSATTAGASTATSGRLYCELAPLGSTGDPAGASAPLGSTGDPYGSLAPPRGSVAPPCSLPAAPTAAH
jgi:hypothetical protein